MGISYEVKDNNYLSINKRENIEEWIEQCNNGNIRIWNFHTGLLLKEINLHSICNYEECRVYLWDNKFLFVGCQTKQ